MTDDDSPRTELEKTKAKEVALRVGQAAQVGDRVATERAMAERQAAQKAKAQTVHVQADIATKQVKRAPLGEEPVGIADAPGQVAVLEKDKAETAKEEASVELPPMGNTGAEIPTRRDEAIETALTDSNPQDETVHVPLADPVEATEAIETTTGNNDVQESTFVVSPAVPLSLSATMCSTKGAKDPPSSDSVTDCDAVIHDATVTPVKVRRPDPPAHKAKDFLSTTRQQQQRQQQRANVLANNPTSPAISSTSSAPTPRDTHVPAQSSCCVIS